MTEPLKLTGLGLVSLDLCIVGYQYPDNWEGGWDSNWLMIECRIKHPPGDWNFLQPCLTTYEIEELAEWFKGLSLNQDRSTQHFPGQCTFTEPNLQFLTTYSANLSTLKPQLHIKFGYESAPPWKSSGDSATLTFPEVDFAAVAANLRDQLAQYPPRSGDCPTGLPYPHPWQPGCK
jgi:hypothetical protein